MSTATAHLNPLAPTRSVRILGSSVHLVDTAYVRARIEGWIQARDQAARQIVVTGFHGLWLAHKDAELKAILRAADLWVPDGISPVWVARLRGHQHVRRVPGTELMKAFFSLANEHGYGSYFYGDTVETLRELTGKVTAWYPGHRVVGSCSPPFHPVTPEEDERLIQQINQSKPDVLWVGLGMPKQERWIFEHRSRLQVPVVVGVGAAFGFLSERVRRCPDWIGQCGFEWAYRFLMEPKKLWRRDLIAGPCFLCHVVMELLGVRNYDKQPEYCAEE